MVTTVADKVDKAPAKADERAERLAKALRANLARRKGQARARQAAGRDEASAAPADAQKPQDDGA